MMWWGDGFGMSAMGVVWMVIMLAVLVLIIVGIVLLARGWGGRREDGQWSSNRQAPFAEGNAGGAERSTPLQILEQRYARGDIDREEFLQRRADLQS